MSISDKLITVANNVPLVYKAGLDKFAEMITANYTRTSYTSLFKATNFEGYIFPQTVSPAKGITTNSDCIGSMFYNYKGTTLPGNISFQYVNGTKTAINNSVFTWSQYLTEIPDLHIGADRLSYNSWFLYCPSIVTIATLPVNENTVFTSTFVGCNSLENITFSGVIGQTIWLGDSVNLSITSMVNIISCLKDYSGTTTTKTLTLHDTAKAKLSTAQIATITQKGWTLA